MNSNAWNRFRYTLISPVYKGVVRGFEMDRQRAIELLKLEKGEKVLLLGCGPGLDLQYIPAGVTITAIDITPGMVERTQKEAARLGIPLDVHVMDGQQLTFEAEQFDAIVLNLILAVIPDPYACIGEAFRVLKPGGRMVIFDKFLPAHQKPPLGRKILNLFTNTLFSDINRQLEPILASISVRVEHEEATRFFSRLGYRITLVRK